MAKTEIVDQPLKLPDQPKLSDDFGIDKKTRSPIFKILRRIGLFLVIVLILFFVVFIFYKIFLDPLPLIRQYPEMFSCLSPIIMLVLASLFPLIFARLNKKL
jgi:hypothetical protein